MVDNLNSLKPDFTVDPFIKKVSLRLEHSKTGDFERILNALKRRGFKEDVECPRRVLEQICDIVRKEDGKISVLFFHGHNTIKIIDIKSGQPSVTYYGLVLDIGTTTVVLQLVNLTTFEVVGEKYAVNPQLSCAGDQEHRIIFSNQENGLAILNNLIIDSINKMIEELSGENKIDPFSIIAVSVTGNTAMQHLFHKIKPRYLRESPFVSAVSEMPFIRAVETGLKINPSGYVYTTPVSCNFLGGDTSAGILSTGLCESEELSLYIDLGTSCEVVMSEGRKLTASSFPANSSFEGTGGSCGMFPAPSAIIKLRFDKKKKSFDYETMGVVKPAGLCGSALLDLIYELRINQIINSKGKFNYDSNDKNFIKRGFYTIYRIVPGSETTSGYDILVNELDIDLLLRAKAALYSGIGAILRKSNKNIEQIKKIFISGNFGPSFDVERAVSLGMLPDIPDGRYEYRCNATLKGAFIALFSRDVIAKISDIASSVSCIDLHKTSEYLSDFFNSVSIPF